MTFLSPRRILNPDAELVGVLVDSLKHDETEKGGVKCGKKGEKSYILLIRFRKFYRQIDFRVLFL